MTIVFVLAKVATFVYFDSVVRALCSRGHRVTVLRGRITKPNQSDRALEACEVETGLCEAGWLLPRRKWRLLSHNVREIINYTNYFRPRHPAPWLAERWDQVLEWYVRPIITNRAVTRILAGNVAQRALRSLENWIPSVREVVSWLEEHRPQVVVASPYIYGHPQEMEYVKAARALHIPTVVPVFSWDNLTIKGTFQIMPDAVLVWNRRLAEEAMVVHNVPPERLVITGAPVFDKWFDKPALFEREAFCRKVGLDPARPFVAYLCSSPYIAGDETAFVREFARGLADRPDTRDLMIVVRPHPTNFTIWEGFTDERIMVWPPQGTIPDIPEAVSDYYNTLFHSVAAVGVNTSGFLEAAIVDRPCVTVMTERYRRTQVGMPHFRHLLDGGFLEIARSFFESAEVLARIMRGVDARAENRRSFVREFIRPHGIDTPAAPIMATAIERVAQGKTPDAA